MFLPFMCRLRSFEIDVNFNDRTMHYFDIVLSFLMGSLCISLTSPATLEHLKVNISFHGRIGDFDSDTFYGDLRDADLWTHLDSIIAHPTGSRLQRVDINLDYCDLQVHDFDQDEPYVDEPDEHDVLNAVLDGLPLLRSKDILFVNVDSIISIHSRHGARYLPGT